MRQFLILTIICLSGTMLSANNSSNSKIQKTSFNSTKDTIYVATKDTLKLSISQNEKIASPLDWQKNMPWIGAVVVGILTIIANLLINKQARISNREVTEKQINNAKDIALTQIETSRKNAQMEFNKTVLSGNRQVWINDLREVVSKILSKIVIMSVRKNFTIQQYEELKWECK